MKERNISDMLEDFLPKYKIGHLSPFLATDYSGYQLYQLAPKGIMFVFLPIGLEEFTPKDVERALAPLEKYLAVLVDRGVNAIVQGGPPIPIIMGMEYHDALLARIEKTTGLPVTSTIQDNVAAAKSLGIRNIVLANKWGPQINKILGMFFEREGIHIAGVNCRSMVPSQFLKLKDDEHMALAYELGREALANNPDADGLYLGGSAWLTYPLVEPLEKEFGKPVIVNEMAEVWHICHMLNCWKPIQGYGRLFASI